MIFVVTNTEPREQRLLSIIRTQTEIASTDLDLEAAMQVVADRGQELTDASGAIVQVPEGEDTFRFQVTSGACRPFVGRRLDRGHSLAGHALRERCLIESDDCANDPRVDRRLTAKMEIGSMICAPLFHRGDAIGVLTVTHPEANHFSAADRQALELMSDLIAAQMAHANSFAVEAHESRHDALTDLANRRAYEEQLAQETSRAQRYKHPLALCLFDLDGFKAINDRHGHPAGDEILRRVADVLRATRRADQGFRIGGDEFALLMPETTACQAERAIARLAAAIEAIEHPPGAGRIGVSFGVAAGHSDADALHTDADRQLLAAKATVHGREGRGGDNVRPIHAVA
jgi:diguanylate cyclase (GGDEF)-like protein